MSIHNTYWNTVVQCILINIASTEIFTVTKIFLRVCVRIKTMYVVYYYKHRNFNVILCAVIIILLERQLLIRLVTRRVVAFRFWWSIRFIIILRRKRDKQIREKEETCIDYWTKPLEKLKIRINRFKSKI